MARRRFYDLVNDEGYKSDIETGGGQMLIKRGDIFWILTPNHDGLDPVITHPHVVIGENATSSSIQTVVVCALTTNSKKVAMPGNVLLEAGEANLPKQSVVEVSKVSTVDKAALGEYIGSLSEQRVRQIIEGMQFLQYLSDTRR
jgi:mRNA interferase MazF